MSDSHRVHRAIKKAMKQVYPENPQGNLARHLETLAAMVSGIVLSQSCQLPKIASKIPGVVHPDSRAKQLSRWVNNEEITFDLYFLPFVRELLSGLAAVRPLVLIMIARNKQSWQCGRPRMCHLDGQLDLRPARHSDCLAGD